MENYIIQPCHNRPAMMCKSWKYIEYEAQSLREFVRSGTFQGKYSSAYSIAHAQVSEAPLNFFVVNEDFDDGKLLKIFGSWCIINPKIIKFSDVIEHPEACMSFPWRKEKLVKRADKIVVKYSVPFLGFFRTIKKELKGLPAWMVQHELDHAAGKNIYGK